MACRDCRDRERIQCLIYQKSRDKSELEEYYPLLGKRSPSSPSSSVALVKMGNKNMTNERTNERTKQATDRLKWYIQSNMDSLLYSYLFLSLSGSPGGKQQQQQHDETR